MHSALSQIDTTAMSHLTAAQRLQEYRTVGQMVMVDLDPNEWMDGWMGDGGWG